MVTNRPVLAWVYMVLNEKNVSLNLIGRIMAQEVFAPIGPATLDSTTIELQLCTFSATVCSACDHTLDFRGRPPCPNRLRIRVARGPLTVLN